MDTLDKIKQLAATQFGREPEAMDADAPIDSLGIDSLGFMEFQFELEDAFGRPIPPESVATVKTLRDLAAVIDGLPVAKPAAES